MIDVQASPDTRNLKIRKVGVKAVSHPIVWADWRPGERPEDAHRSPSVGQFSLLVELSPERKGVHMSRFLEALYVHTPEMNLERLMHLCQDLLPRLEAPRAFVDLQFRYFYEKPAPISGQKGLADVDVSLHVSVDANGATSLQQLVRVPVTSLCPCSKAISVSSAHNQRGIISILAHDAPGLSFSDCVAAAEAAASCAVYPLLKRVDEKHVTEEAYDNPRFVEDLVREAAVALRAHSSIPFFEISAENFESIHNHNVWAVLSSDEM